MTPPRRCPLRPEIALLIALLALATHSSRVLPWLWLPAALPGWLGRSLERLPFAALGALLWPGLWTALPEAPWLGLGAGLAAAVWAWFRGGLALPILIALALTWGGLAWFGL